MVGAGDADIVVKNPEDYDRVRRHEPGQLGARRWCGSRPTSRSRVTGQVLRMVGNSLCVYEPWRMGEEFFATDKDGNPTQWDPAQVGRILNRYAFRHAPTPASTPSAATVARVGRGLVSRLRDPRLRGA